MPCVKALGQRRAYLRAEAAGALVPAGARPAAAALGAAVPGAVDPGAGIPLGGRRAPACPVLTYCAYPYAASSPSPSYCPSYESEPPILFISSAFWPLHWLTHATMAVMSCAGGRGWGWRSLLLVLLRGAGGRASRTWTRPRKMAMAPTGSMRSDCSREGGGEARR